MTTAVNSALVMKEETGACEGWFSIMDNILRTWVTKDRVKAFADAFTNTCFSNGVGEKVYGVDGRDGLPDAKSLFKDNRWGFSKDTGFGAAKGSGECKGHPKGYNDVQ